jgi:hypothetical protein
MIRLFAAALILASTSAAAQTDSESQALAKAAAGFYGVYMTLHPSDGIPDGPTRAKFAPFVSPGLDQLFADGEGAEARYAKATKNQSPPLVEGDPFTPNFEGATSYKIGACTSDAAGGHCAVTLTYDDRKDKPLVWTDTVALVRTPGGLRVDDIAYGGSWDFGNKGHLTGLLKSVIAESASFSK